MTDFLTIILPEIWYIVKGCFIQAAGACIFIYWFIKSKYYKRVRYYEEIENKRIQLSLKYNLFLNSFKTNTNVLCFKEFLNQVVEDNNSKTKIDADVINGSIKMFDNFKHEIDDLYNDMKIWMPEDILIKNTGKLSTACQKLIMIFGYNKIITSSGNDASDLSIKHFNDIFDSYNVQIDEIKKMQQFQIQINDRRPQVSEKWKQIT